MFGISWFQIVTMFPMPLFFTAIIVARGGMPAVPYALLQAWAVGAINLQEVHSVNFLAVTQGFARTLQKRLLQLKPETNSKMAISLKTSGLDLK